MPRLIRSAVIAVALALGLACTAAPAQQTEPRLAFVVGNASYPPRPLATALNDAGLVAESLRSIGFEVVDGADLGQADFMRSFGEFVAKVEAAGPDALVLVYFSGYGFQYDGENFLLAAQANLASDGDIASEGIRLSDSVRPLADAPARAKVVVVDAGRPLPYQIPGRRMAPGLGAVDSPPGMLLAFAAAPGTVVEEEAGSYGAYATAFAEMVRNPGLDLDSIFVRIRARAHQISEGRQTPWHVSALGADVLFVPGDAQADVAAPPPPLRAASRPRPMREVGPDEAYAQAIELDTLPGYVDFVSAYPRHVYAPRIWATIRARREALAWLRAVQLNTPPAYWTYLRRYPDGVYSGDAEFRLRRLSASRAPPPTFAPVEFFDVPPPLSEEPAAFVAAPPRGPRPPALLIAPPPPFFARLPPPPARRPAAPGVRILPVPVVIPAVPRIVPARPGVAPAVVSPGVVPPAAGRPPAPAAVRPGVPPGAGRPGVAPGAPRPAVVDPARPAAAPPGQRPPPPAAIQRPPPPAAIQRPPPPAAIQRPPPPAAIQRPPPPAAIQRPPPPAAIQRPPPPAAIQRPPPPAAIQRPPPPAAIQRPPPVQRPAPVAPRPAPPVAAPRPAAPAAAARPAAPPARPAAPAAAAKRCQVVNGVQVCR